MNDRFKFRAVLKTDTHSIIAEPHYIFDNGYLVNIDDVQKPFEKKYPDDCFWEFIEEIEKQENCQEVSTDSEIIIFDSFDGLIQCTGLKDKNGNLIFEGDIVKTTLSNEDISKQETVIFFVYWSNEEGVFNGKIVCQNNIKFFFIKEDYLYYLLGNEEDETEVIGNIYENKELLESEG